MPRRNETEGPRVPPSIQSSNLSEAWLQVLEHATQPGVASLDPLMVTVTGFSPEGAPNEVPAVRELIDLALANGWAEDDSDEGGQAPKGTPPLTCRTVANTIFPASLWNPGHPRAALYERYRQILPSLRKDPRNKRGLYFERLINYPEGLKNNEDGNQLEHLIGMFKGGVKRKSAYQATITWPKKDSTALPLQGFPCLQQIALTPDRRRGTLAITGFYGTQYIFERAYGNYLGLCRLGAFLASEMGLRMERMTCIASHAPRDITMARGRKLVKDARDVIESAGAAT